MFANPEHAIVKQINVSLLLKIWPGMRWGSLYPSFCQGFRTTEIGANDHWPLSDCTAVHGLRREKVFKSAFDVAVQCACETSHLSGVHCGKTAHKKQCRTPLSMNSFIGVFSRTLLPANSGWLTTDKVFILSLVHLVSFHTGSRIDPGFSPSLH